MCSTLEELSHTTGAGEDSLNFTALCRVLPGQVRVVEGDGSVLQSRHAQGASQTTYWWQREEYMVGRPSHVMPEFLIAFHIEGFRDVDDADADAADGDGDGGDAADGDGESGGGELQLRNSLRSPTRVLTQGSADRLCWMALGPMIASPYRRFQLSQNGWSRTRSR